MKSNNAKTRVIAIAGSKGGVGKTTVSCNLAIALQKQYENVLLLDADFGLANVDVHLGLKNPNFGKKVIEGQVDIHNSLIEGPSGIKILPGSSGLASMANLSVHEVAGLMHNVASLRPKPDILIIDLPAGIINTVTNISSAANEIIVVVCNEPSSIADAYAYIKLMHNSYGHSRFKILVNMVPTKSASNEVFAKLTKVTDRFLDVVLELIGHIPFDNYLTKAISKQKAVVDIFPSSKSGVAFYELANKVLKQPVQDFKGGLSFFLEEQLDSTGIN